MIELKRVHEAYQNDVKAWLLDQFITTSKDFGQKLNSDDLEHLTSRTFDILNEHYKGMYIGNLKPIFFNGMSGVYGGPSKLTVQTILLWIKGAERSKITQNADTQEVNSTENTKRYYNETYDRSGEFVIWMNKNNVDYPESQPAIKGQCSPDFIEFRELYHKAKAGGYLEDFKGMLEPRKSFIQLL